MTVQELNMALNGIDDKYLSTWEVEKTISLNRSPKGGRYQAKPAHRKLWVLILAACLVFALAVTAYAVVNILGIRDMLSGTTQALPSEVEPYITPETAATEAEEGWSCALTQSLYTGDKLLITVTVSGGDQYIVAPTYCGPEDSTMEIGLDGSQTLQEYAAQQDKKLLFAGARVDLDGWDGNGQGQLMKNTSPGEMTILISGDHLVDIPETLTGTCEVYVVDAENRGIEDVMRQKLPLTLTAAPQPEGEGRTFTLQSGEVPGLRFAEATLTKTLTGYKFQLPFAVVDKKAVENYLKVYCPELDFWGWLDFGSGNIWLEDLKNADFDKITLEIRDEDSVPVGSVVMAQKQ